MTQDTPTPTPDDDDVVTSDPNSPSFVYDPVQRAEAAEPAVPLEPVTDDELETLDDHPEYTEPIEDVNTPGDDDDEIYDAGEDDEITEENYEKFLPPEDDAKEEGFEVDKDSGKLTGVSQVKWDETPPDPQNLAAVDGKYQDAPTPAPQA